MTYIVTELCLDCKHTSCVSVCPVDCFHESDRSLYIDPIECIDCGACVPECPEEAIFPEAEVPPEYEQDIARNTEMAAKFPVITEVKEPLNRRGDCHSD